MERKVEGKKKKKISFFLLFGSRKKYKNLDEKFEC